MTKQKIRTGETVKTGKTVKTVKTVKNRQKQDQTYLEHHSTYLSLQSFLKLGVQ